VFGKDFEKEALEIFRFQAANNLVYQQWLLSLKTKPENISTIQQIPFLPIEFFKSQTIFCEQLNSDATCFTSSATTSQTPAKHYVNDISIYETSFLKGFELFYGSVNQYCILALLPNYLQRQGSSLVYMVDYLIKKGNHIESGFYLDNVNDLKQKINQLKKQKEKVLLIGVSYALLDLCELEIELNENFIVMETGGMKGRRKEMIKEELHDTLKKGLGVKNIHSEYGMTELLSQAYSKGNGIFETPPWMRFLIRDIDDPFQLQQQGKTGGINVIDLANINSCSFIATQDLGKLNKNNQLELMGRFDHSDVRGCNLMVGGF
jgi:phenylacetate-coenzyme A ligase PaaK-like adenylate-forming protein